MALAITTGTTAPLLTTTPASAQLFHDNQLRSQSQLGLPSQSDTSREKIVIAPKTMPLTLTVAANIVNRSGSVQFQLEVKLLVNCNPPMEAPNLLLENGYIPE